MKSNEEKIDYFLTLLLLDNLIKWNESNTFSGQFNDKICRDRSSRFQHICLSAWFKLWEPQEDVENSTRSIDRFTHVFVKFMFSSFSKSEFLGRWTTEQIYVWKLASYWKMLWFAISFSMNLTGTCDKIFAKNRFDKTHITNSSRWLQLFVIWCLNSSAWFTKNYFLIKTLILQS